MQGARRFIVSGRVQGVGFRAAARDAAAARALSGWVANRDDGTVALVAAGQDAALDELAEWLGNGPPAARVTGVTQHDAPNAKALPTPFEIR